MPDRGLWSRRVDLWIRQAAEQGSPGRRWRRRPRTEPWEPEQTAASLGAEWPENEGKNAQDNSELQLSGHGISIYIIIESPHPVKFPAFFDGFNQPPKQPRVCDLPFSLEAAHNQVSVTLSWKQLNQRSVISESDQTHQDCRTKERKQTLWWKPDR